MRRGVWVVLGLVGVAPFGALAEEGQGQPAEQEGTESSEQAGMALPDETANTSGIILEIPEGGIRLPGVLGAQQSLMRERAREAGTGGSGMRQECVARTSFPNEESFLGTLRASEPGRLVMQGPEQRIYEFVLENRTQVLGPNGAPVAVRVFQVGTPVRTVTQPGEFANRVLTLQILGQAPARSR